MSKKTLQQAWTCSVVLVVLVGTSMESESMCFEEGEVCL